MKCHRKLFSRNVRCRSRRQCTFSMQDFSLVSLVLSEYSIYCDEQTQNISATDIRITVVVFSTAFSAFYYYMILRGKNWARIIFLVFFVFSFVYGVIMAILGQQSLHIVSVIIGTIIGAGAAILLFLPSSSQWFRQVKDTRMKQA